MISDKDKKRRVQTTRYTNPKALLKYLDMIDIEMMINHFKAAISNRRMLCFNIIRQTLYNLIHKTIRLLVSFLLHAYWIAT